MKPCCDKCERTDYERDEYDRGIGLTTDCSNPSCKCHSDESNETEGWDLEVLSAKLHDIYQKEAHRQEDAGIGKARHYDEYDKLSEPVKEFDRVLARFIISEILTAKRDTVREILETMDKMVGDISLQPHFPGGANEIRKRSQIQILKDLAEKLRNTLTD